MALVFLAVFVFLNAERLVCLADWKYEEESMSGPRDESQQLGLIYAENVMES
jgi:hypothetical protein